MIRFFLFLLLQLIDQYSVRIVFNNDESTDTIRSIPPSSPPKTLSAKQNHVPSLSPINSSTESTPTSDSPPMKFKSNNSNDFLRGSKAKSVLSSILNNKNANKRFVLNSFTAA